MSQELPKNIALRKSLKYFLIFFIFSVILSSLEDVVPQSLAIPFYLLILISLVGIAISLLLTMGFIFKLIFFTSFEDKTSKKSFKVRPIINYVVLLFSGYWILNSIFAEKILTYYFNQVPPPAHERFKSGLSIITYQQDSTRFQYTLLLMALVFMCSGLILISKYVFKAKTN